MTNKKLQKIIEKKLTKLAEIIEEIRNFDIQPDDPEMWDVDYYSQLQEELQQAFSLAEDIPDLIDEYQAETEDDEE